MNELAKNREPVSTYEQALMWLVKFWGNDWKIFLGANRLPPEAMLIADMFWVSETMLRADITKECRALDQASAFEPARRFRFFGKLVA
ncbi:hypothetical protein [Cypionkella sp.]|uniref:hypothetical protein n=1 Tax=Cypionkella sp. TaxID=2811411 RepID=UPI002ABB1E4A|nr:hypothetical protein [Cypionkella sp.]MDZ4393448.1 hypothetical protein [Cypionkella sp.]